VEKLGRKARGWRLGVTGVAIGVLLYGSAAGTDDMFPFGPFRMYAGYYPPDGVITSNDLFARTATGQVVRPTAADIGLARGDIEGELGAFVSDPARLADLAEVHHRLHPQAPAYVSMWISQKRWQLHNRAVVGQSIVTLVTWDAA
jgi:uncharacterized protein YjiS (DUF1127 family)